MNIVKFNSVLGFLVKENWDVYDMKWLTSSFVSIDEVREVFPSLFLKLSSVSSQVRVFPIMTFLYLLRNDIDFLFEFCQIIGFYELAIILKHLKEVFDMNSIMNSANIIRKEKVISLQP